MFAAASNSTGLVLTLPSNYLFVGLVGVGTFWVNVFQATMVSKYRKLVSREIRAYTSLVWTKLIPVLFC
jgi:hypothetical protein